LNPNPAEPPNKKTKSEAHPGSRQNLDDPAISAAGMETPTGHTLGSWGGDGEEVAGSLNRAGMRKLD